MSSCSSYGFVAWLGVGSLLAACAASPAGFNGRGVERDDRHQAAAASAEVVTAAPPSETAAASSAEPAAPPSREARLLAQLAKVSGKKGRSVLLLGLHDEPVETYAWLFGSAGEPPHDPAPAYRTLVLDVRDGEATLAIELPFLVVPGARGFRFVGEASAVAYEEVSFKTPGAEVDGLGAPIPHHFAATALWETEKRGEVVSEPKALAKRLARRRKWGETTSETVLVQTPHARCTLSSWSSWTGGALAFRGSSDVGLDVGGRSGREALLGSYVDDPELTRVTRAIERFDKEPTPASEEAIDLDAKRSLGLWQEYVPRKEIRACLVREGGRVALAGAAKVYGNSARSFDKLVPSIAAPASLVGATAPLPFDLAAWSAAVPGLFDAIASPTGDVLGLLREEGLFFYSGVTHARLFEVPVSPDAAVVMAEWARDDEADRWLEELTKPWPKGVAEASQAQHARAIASRTPPPAPSDEPAPPRAANPAGLD